MERFIAAISAMAGNIPVLAWLGYIQFTRPSRKECYEKHKAEAAGTSALCTKMNMIYDLTKENNRILLDHVMRTNKD